ncbi:HAD-IC family P-type ATPase [Candidatus Uhrbacteria bacterium]|nr:HAD-IC family P-type ATPase [Candidatus Uhrbacteria bacterium]
MKEQERQQQSAIPWHTLPLKSVEDTLQTPFATGLTFDEVKKRLATYGANQLPEETYDSLTIIFFRQFANPLIAILLLSSVVMIFIRHFSDAIIITVVLVFNAVIGAIQEGRAQKTLSALKRFAVTNAVVLREGQDRIVPDTDVVPGDILLVQEGAKIPADARIIEAYGLRVDEAALTGESGPIDKQVKTFKDPLMPVADRTNMILKGTAVLSGNGIAVAVETGLRTEFGKISTAISKIESEIPLKRDIEKLSRFILIAISTISVALFGSGVYFGADIFEMFVIVVALAVSVVPEGLPVVLTIVLANGVWRMARRNALIKRLQAVEALGQADIIAVDKTGTITKNEMVARLAYVESTAFTITGDGYAPKGAILRDEMPIDPKEHGSLQLFHRIGSLSANAHTAYSEAEKRWTISGDPTEAAMAVCSAKCGETKESIDQTYPRIAEIPFTTSTKYHAALARGGKNTMLLAIAGAPEAIMAVSKKIREGGKDVALSKARQEAFEKAYRAASHKGLRVIAVAYREFPKKKDQLAVEDIASLTLLGFYGIEDTIRAEVKSAVESVRRAGTRGVMITGDHRLTGQAIAQKAGIFQEGDDVITGKELETLSTEELKQRLARVTVFARVTAEHKMKIIESYKARGEIIAMTGDGVNDAAALMAADLGISMGKVGTDVAKEASDIILLDDNFASIVAALEEGRAIYRSIKRALLYLFSTNISEMLIIIIAVLGGFPLPLTAAQIIWLNLVTDSFPVIALAMEPKSNEMRPRTPAQKKQGIFDTHMKKRTILMGLTMTATTFMIFAGYFQTDLAKAQTMTFVTLACAQLFNSLNCRSRTNSLFRMNLLSNRWLIGAIAFAAALQFIAVYSPLLRSLLHTVPLSAQEWGVAIGAGSVVILADEIRKFFGGNKQNHQLTLWNHSSTSTS